MSETQTIPSTAAAAVRAVLMDDLATIDVFAEATGKSARTIQRLIAEKKLPVVTIGRTPYVMISRAREALMSEMRCGHEPVRRGRPARRKVA